MRHINLQTMQEEIPIFFSKLQVFVSVWTLLTYKKCFAVTTRAEMENWM